MMTTTPMITIKDKQFEPFIHHEQIADKVTALAAKLNADYAGQIGRAHV